MTGLGIALVIGAGVLAATLIGGSSNDRSNARPTTAEREAKARRAASAVAKEREQRAQAMDAALTASSQLLDAYFALGQTLAANTQREKDAVARNDAAAARITFQQDADALSTFYEALSRIQFPASTEQDVRALLSAITNAVVAARATADPDSDFNTSLMAYNQAIRAVYDARLALNRDLANIIEPPPSGRVTPAAS